MQKAHLPKVFDKSGQNGVCCDPLAKERSSGIWVLWENWIMVISHILQLLCLRRRPNLMKRIRRFLWFDVLVVGIASA